MRRLRVGVALGITLLWAAGYTRALLDTSYKAPAEIIPVVLIAVGFILGGEIIRINKNGKNGGPK